MENSKTNGKPTEFDMGELIRFIEMENAEEISYVIVRDERARWPADNEEKISSDNENDAESKSERTTQIRRTLKFLFTLPYSLLLLTAALICYVIERIFGALQKLYISYSDWLEK